MYMFTFRRNSFTRVFRYLCFVHLKLLSMAYFTWILYVFCHGCDAFNKSFWLLLLRVFFFLSIFLHTQMDVRVCLFVCLFFAGQKAFSILLFHRLCGIDGFPFTTNSHSFATITLEMRSSSCIHRLQ